MGECPLCGESTSKPSTRLIKESCGHSKCRLCLLNEESGCSVCEVNNGGIPCTIESIGNFDYRLPATSILNYEELHSTPRKLDFNKIPADDFTDCPLVEEKATLDNSINQNCENVASNVPEMVDMATETENIVPDKDVQSQTVPENTHSSLSQIALPEVFTNPVISNHPAPQETPVVQNPNFIPVSNPVVTQRPDGRQFITIAFIANNSPNKNQHVVTPILNQCLPALANMTAVQRPAGNQCIPMIGNINALQNGSQFIIRNSNIVQNLVGNQSVPVIGNLNAMPSLTGNASLSLVGNVNTVKNLAGNQASQTIATANPPQSPTKGQSFSTTASPNVAHKVVGNNAYQVTQAAPKPAENQPQTPVEEDVGTARKQTRTRGLPRIKNVKNVNIVQKSATNQSDKTNSQIEKVPVQATRGKRQKRKELPVYLIPRKPTNEQVKNPPPMRSPPPLKSISPPANSPARVFACLSPEYKLEDYLLFNKQQQTSVAATKNSDIQTEAVNNTPIIVKPPESVINETPIVSEQFNGTVMEENLAKNNVDELKEKDRVLEDKTSDEQITKDIGMETVGCKEHQDLNVVFNITEENNRTLDEKIEEEKEKIKIPNGETSSNKEEYQNLDALFDIIEKESKKLNGGIFDKEENLDGENDFEYEENQINSKDENYTFEQKGSIDEVEEQNLNHDICNGNGDSQDLHEGKSLQNKETENFNEGICTNDGLSKNSHEISCVQENNLVEGLSIQNGTMQDAESEQEKNHILNAGMEYEKEESEILNEKEECQNLNHETVAGLTNSAVMNGEIDNEEHIQTANKELSLQNEENQYFNDEIASQEEDSNDENKVNDEPNSIDKGEESNRALYEDISDEEDNSEKSNREMQELQTAIIENNDERTENHDLDEKTVEEERQVSDQNVNNQGDESSPCLTMETHQEDNAPSDVNTDLPILETNDQDNSELDSTIQSELSGAVRKRRGRPKKQTYELELPHDNVVGGQIDNGEKKPENENPAAATENSGKPRRDRKKKLYSDYELDIKPARPDKNQQSVVRKPRGRPKKSSSNAEPTDKLNSSQEAEQPAPVELPSEEGQNQQVDEKLDDPENHVLNVSVEVHNPEQEDKAKGIVDSNDKSLCAEKDDSELAVVAKRPRGRPKYKSVSFDISQPSESKVKKPRGRPKRSLSVIEQPNALQKTDASTITEVSNTHEKSDDNESQNQASSQENERNDVQDGQVLQQEEKSKTLSMDVDYEKIEILPSDVIVNSTFIDQDDAAVQEPPALSAKEQSAVIKKRGRPKKSLDTQPVVKRPRGRPRKSLFESQQSNELNASQQTEDRKEDEENQVQGDQLFSTNFVDMGEGESESLANSTLCDETPNIVSANEQPMVVKKRGRKKKLLSTDEQPEIPILNVQAVVKKARGRPRKSLPNVELDVSQEREFANETEITNQSLVANVEESKDQCEIDRGDDENQAQDEGVFAQEEKVVHEEKAEVNDDAAIQQPGTADENDQPTVAKKLVGRPKKSLSNFELKAPQEETELSSTTDIPKQTAMTNAEEINDRGDDENQVQNNEDLGQEENSQNSSEHVVNEKLESLHTEEDANATTKQPGIVNENELPTVVKKPRELNVPQEERELSNTIKISNETAMTNVEESRRDDEIQVRDREVFSQEEIGENSSEKMESLHSEVNNAAIHHLGVVKKPRGRSKKSLSTTEQPEVSDCSVQPIAVKKPRGRPKKSLSGTVKPSEHDTMQETELSHVQNEESNDQQETNECEERVALSQAETSQYSSVEVGENEVVASSTFSEKKASDEKTPDVLNGNEQSVEKPSDETKTSELENTQPTGFKNIEQPDERETEPAVSDDQKGQTQCLNGAVAMRIDGRDEKIDDSSASLYNEHVENSIFETEMNTPSNQSSVADKLDTTCQSEQTIVIKKARGRPKSSTKIVQNHEGTVVVKKPRGRPKKLNQKQPNESRPSQENEQHQAALELPTFSTDDAKKPQRLVDDVESPILDIADGTNRDERENDKSDDPTLSKNINYETQVDSTSGAEADEDQTPDNASNDDEENYSLEVELDEEERSASDNQISKSPDDENKENKEAYSENDDAKTDNAVAATQEQDRLEKSGKEDDVVAKNNNITVRKYKKFDSINAQVIVDNGKRKRKPKVWLYENDESDSSPARKKRKNDKSDGKVMTDKKAQVVDLKDVDESSVDSDEHTAKSTEITVNSVSPVQVNDTTESVDREELSQDESSSNAAENSSETEGNDLPGASQKDESPKRNRRSKILLYENDLSIRPKGMKKKRVSFLLPESEDTGTIDDFETSAREAFTSECESKNGDGTRKSKTLEVKERAYIKPEIKREDLMMMRKFEITLEPIIVLDRNIDLSLVKKYEPKDGGPHPTHQLTAKRPRGRPRMQSPNSEKVSKKVKYTHSKLGKETTAKKPRVRRSYSHITTLPGEPPTYKCTGCDQTFKAYSYRALHAICAPAVAATFKCEYCPKKFKQGSHRQYHERVHKGERPCGCELCGKRFVQKSKLNRHMLIHKYTQDLECNECGKKFVSKEYLKSHLLSHVKSSFAFRCNQCPKSFTLDSNRRRHELSHSPIALIKCQYCAKSFKTKYESNKHAKIHMKVRPFCCHDCDKTFITKTDLKRHTIHHSGDKKYTCTHCKQQFGRLDNYSRHMLHHHPIDEPTESAAIETNVEATLSSEDDDEEEPQQDKRTDKPAVKPKKISITSSNPVPLSISFVQPLTPQPVPSPYSQSHDLASVIRETLPDLNNAVPVISSAVSIQPSPSLMDPIPLEQAFVLNRQIEEKIYTQTSICEFPGLTRRASVVNRLPSFTLSRRSSSGSNSNSNDGTSFFGAHRERTAEQQRGDEEEANSPRKDIHVHWRRRTAETLKSKIDQNK